MDACQTMDTQNRSMRDLLESLPQEIYDEIYNLTFIINDVRADWSYRRADKVVKINKKYRFPPLLRVNRMTRAKVAALYYANNRFVGDYLTIKEWLNLLPLEHRSLINDVRVWCYRGDQDALGGYRHYPLRAALYGRLLKHLLHRDTSDGVRVRVLWRPGDVFRSIEEERGSKDE